MLEGTCSAGWENLCHWDGLKFNVKNKGLSDYTNWSGSPKKETSPTSSFSPYILRIW